MAESNHLSDKKLPSAIYEAQKFANEFVEDQDIEEVEEMDHEEEKVEVSESIAKEFIRMVPTVIDIDEWNKRQEEKISLSPTPIEQIPQTLSKKQRK